MNHRASTAFLKVYLFLFYVLECLASVHVHAMCACLVALQAGKGCHIPWKWMVVSSVWVLGTELGSSERAVHAINH